MLVGLTGGIGSGKTTVAKMLAAFDNVVVYFADDEAKKLMNTSKQIKERLIEEFSEEVYNSEGLLNRPFLAGIVFSDKEKLKTLNSIVHPVVHQHLQDFLKTHKDKDYILYENAILFENGSNKLCDKIITVTAPEELRIDRVMKRDNVSYEEVKNRIKNQWTDEKKTIQSHYLVHNLNITVVNEQIKNIHNKLTES